MNASALPPLQWSQHAVSTMTQSASAVHDACGGSADPLPAGGSGAGLLGDEQAVTTTTRTKSERMREVWHERRRPGIPRPRWRSCTRARFVHLRGSQSITRRSSSARIARRSRPWSRLRSNLRRQVHRSMSIAPRSMCIQLEGARPLFPRSSTDNATRRRGARRARLARPTRSRSDQIQSVAKRQDVCSAHRREKTATPIPLTRATRPVLASHFRAKARKSAEAVATVELAAERAAARPTSIPPSKPRSRAAGTAYRRNRRRAVLISPTSTAERSSPCRRPPHTSRAPGRIRAPCTPCPRSSPACADRRTRR